MKDLRPYLIYNPNTGKYFSGGIWGGATRALLFSSKKEALFTFPELEDMEIKFIRVILKFKIK